MKQPFAIFAGSRGSAGVVRAVQSSSFTLHHCAVLVGGTFSATVDVEVSPDGVNWVTAMDVGGAQLAGVVAGTHVLAGDAAHVRVNISAYTSGTVEIWIIPERGGNWR